MARQECTFFVVGQLPISRFMGRWSESRRTPHQVGKKNMRGRNGIALESGDEPSSQSL
jgi:hypothetical protein